MILFFLYYNLVINLDFKYGGIKMKRNRVGFGLLLSMAVVLSANAQTFVPQNTEAGAVGSYDLNQVENKKIEKKLEKKQDKSGIDNNFAKSQVQKGEVKKLQFVLKGIDFEDNTIFTDSELNEFFAKYINKKVDYKDLVKISEEITAKYKKAGYITSLAYLPPQEVVNGVLKVKVIEGKVGNIAIEGNKWTKERYLKTIVLDKNGIEKDDVFNVNNLKNSMIEINSQPHLKGKIYLNKGEAVKTTDFRLRIEEKMPLGLTAGWDNQGRDLIGKKRASIGIVDYNLTGFGDQLATNVSMANGTTGVGTNYLLPLNGKGTVLNLDYGYSGVDIGGVYKPSKIEGTSHFYRIGVTQPIFKNQRFDVKADAGFDFRDSETTSLFGRENAYQTRVLRTGISATEDDFNGRWIARSQASFGLPLMGGQRSGMNSIADSQFFKLNANLVRVHILPVKVLGIARLSGQWANKTLYGSEQMQIGGAYTVRGFEEGSLLGDTGYSLSLEARRTIPYLKDVNLPYWKDRTFLVPLKDRLSAATFYDFGMTKANFRGVNTSYRNFLQSVGVGLRCNVTKYLSANFDFAFPLGRERYAGQNDLKFHFSLSSSIL